MEKEVYYNIEKWFNSYVTKFKSEVSDKTNVDLIKNHSLRVSELVSELSEQWELSERELVLAKIAGLLHDIGRFEQLIKSETFSDTAQINHTQLAISIVDENNLLAELSEEESKIVMDSILFHNETLLQASIEPASLPFIKLLRDADKIDILTIVSNYYSNSKQGSNKRLEMELLDKNEISKKVIQSILNEKVVDKKDVLNLNDLKLQQMSLIFDLNCKKSFKIVSEKTYLKQIYETMPKKDEVIDMYRQIKIFLENQL